MALVVEDGAGRPDAESYLSVAAFQAYCAAHGLSLDGHDEAAQEIALRKATAYIDGHYGRRWPGYRASRDQALDWPRAYAVDRDGYEIGSDEIPREVKAATAEAAHRALTGDLAPDVEAGQATIRSESKQFVGGMGKSVTYSTGTGPAAPVFRRIDQALARIIGVGAGVLTLERA